MKNLNRIIMIAFVVGSTQNLFAQKKTLPAAKSEKREQLRIETQKICPISGVELGKHGNPVLVKVGEVNVFLCCKACLTQKIKPKHWVTIHKNFAKAQKICPVMKNKLPKKPQWTIVEGQVVYICCPPCANEIKADSKAYLQQVDQLYTAFLAAKSSNR